MDYFKLCHSIPSVTQNKSFEKNGYLYLPKLINDCENIRCPPPVDSQGKRLVGQYSFYGKNRFKYTSEEQVEGSLARYNIPVYKRVHRLIGKSIENVLGIDVFPTYFYDRFYYLGQELKPHSDRPACEISVTLQVSSTSNKPWPIWFELPDNSVEYVNMNDGDGVIYRGCDRIHWRHPLKGDEDVYHHQIFFHYVNAQGPFVHYAFDRKPNSNEI